MNPISLLLGRPSAARRLCSDTQEHPEIYLCDVKEPQSFAADVLGDFRRVLSWGEYVDCFKGAGGAKRVGEASVAYLGSASAPGQIRAFCPAARIIIMLRNPVDMMYSLHSERVFENGEPITDFAAALQADEDRERGLRPARPRPPGLSYRDTARYAQQVRRYLDVFGRDQVRIILLEDFESNASAVYREVLEFLDVRRDFRPRFKVYNSSHRVRSRTLMEFLEHPPASFRKRVHAVSTQRMRRLAGKRAPNLAAQRFRQT